MLLHCKAFFLVYRAWVGIFPKESIMGELELVVTISCTLLIFFKEEIKAMYSKWSR